MTRVLWCVSALVLGLLSGVPVPALPLVSIGLSVLAFACLAAAVFRSPRRGSLVPPLAGGAWARWEDAAAFASAGPFLLGLWPGTRAPLYLSEEQMSGHVLVLGPSRSGKTAGVIAPNILLRDPARESIVVLDVKTGPRSLWSVTAGRYGPRARMFCPLFEGSLSYNPLEEIDSISAAQRKAALLIHNTTRRDLSGDAWVYAAAAADLATLLFLHIQQERPAGHTVGAVYRLLLEGPGAVGAALRGSRIPEVRDRQGMFTARERRVRDAAVTGLLERLAPWADPVVAAATSRHWDLRTLGREPSALYVLLPESDAHRLQPLVAWLVADLLDGLIEEADRAGLRCPVRLYLDEFKRFGYLSGLSARLPTLRERGVSVVLGVQVVSQIEEVYGYREARTLLGNTETKVLFRAGDLETARMVSAWLGSTSVPAVSMTTGGRAGRSVTVRPYVRPLAAVEDVAAIPEGALITLTGAARPLALLQARYFEIPGVARTPPPFPLIRRASLILAPSPPACASSSPRRTPPRPAGGVRG